MNEETIYDRWDTVQWFLNRLDADLAYAAVEGAVIKPRTVEVTFARQTADGDNERVTREYRFAQRPREGAGQSASR